MRCQWSHGVPCLGAGRWHVPSGGQDESLEERSLGVNEENAQTLGGR